MFQNQGLELPDEKGWLAYDDVRKVSIDINEQPVECGVFYPNGEFNETLTVFVGGVPRSEALRLRMPVINKFFGYVAAGLSSEGGTGLSFNWPGVGNSAGDILSTSLDMRSEFLQKFTEQAIKQYGATHLNLVGSSMGAYCAALVAEKIEGVTVAHQSFLSPAAYPASAHPLAYSHGFREEISADWEPQDSPVSRIVSDTKIPTLVAFCEKDDPVIPSNIQKMYQVAAELNPQVEYYVIDGVYHNFRCNPDDPSGSAIDHTAVRIFGNKLLEFLQG